MSKGYVVRVRVTPPSNLSFDVREHVMATSINHARGAGQYAVQMRHPSSRTEVVEWYRVEADGITPTEAL